MISSLRYCLALLVLVIGITSINNVTVAGEVNQEKGAVEPLADWRKKAAEYGATMSRLKWTPVADGMPMRGGYFQKGVEYTGVPYSSVKSEGRYIGFDIYLKTFLAAVQNPDSVLYTENLTGKVVSAECYYGKVCSSYTSYALQCGIWNLSWFHGPTHRQGVELLNPQDGRSAQVGDVIFRPAVKAGKGSHIELVTEIFRDDDGEVTHVRVEESTPPVMKNTKYDVAGFNAHIGSRNRELYRITDLNAWRESNRADSFLFPNYEEDAADPVINRVLLVDRGDWVPYFKGQTVRFNIMDKDAQGVNSLVIERNGRVVETIDQPGIGVIQRQSLKCGDYTAYCLMNDDSKSQAVEFAVCDLGFSLPHEEVRIGEAWEIDIRSENMNAIIVYFKSGEFQHNVYISEQERKAGKVVIPSDVIQRTGEMEVWLIGENKYGRLKQKQEFVVDAQS